MAMVYEHLRVAGPFAFVSGQTPLDDQGEVPADAGGQVRLVVGKIEGLLQGIGMSLADVVKVSYFLTDIADLAEVREALDQLLPHPRPAAVLVEVSALIDPRFRIEIDAIAHRT